jgi:hypothetical protein
MNRKQINQAINDSLLLAMLDMVDNDIPSMSHREISQRTGMSIKASERAEEQALVKLRNNPDAWNLITSICGRG